ncbi:MAG: FHA domain-containing protein [Chloroflexi bacterium]|nr:FHA domain-containing protein [Chloroflexota bacterium]
MAYQLVMKTGPASGKVYPLEKSEISIGREAGSDVFINDEEVSRRHARLTSQFGDYVLEDLGSTNGTFVNSQRITGQRILKPADTILLGENISLTFEEVPFDPNATQVSLSSEASEPEPSEYESAAPQEAQYPSSPPPTYAGQIPESPVEPLIPEESSPRRTWLWAGCGCAVVLTCILIGSAFVFDYLNLYCVPPFRGAMVLIGAACP